MLRSVNIVRKDAQKLADDAHVDASGEPNTAVDQAHYSCTQLIVLDRS